MREPLEVAAEALGRAIDACPPDMPWLASLQRATRLLHDHPARALGHVLHTLSLLAASTEPVPQLSEHARRAAEAILDHHQLACDPPEVEAAPVPAEVVGLTSEAAVLDRLATTGHLRHAQLEGFTLTLPLDTIDLRWSSWTEMVFHGSLRHASLGAASLQDVDLSGAMLVGVDLEGTRLARIDLTRANATNVDFTVASLMRDIAVEGAQLDGAQFVGAVLENVDWRQTQLKGARFTRCLLSGANMAGMDLSGIDFTNSTLTGANLEGATLDDACLRQTCFREANLDSASLLRADAIRADFRAARMSNAVLRKADLSGANLSGANGAGVVAVEACFDRALLGGCDLELARLTGASLRYADLSHANLHGANVTRADLRGADLHRAIIEPKALASATTAGARRTDPDRARAEDFTCGA